jgi:hypothetical protein
VTRSEDEKGYDATERAHGYVRARLVLFPTEDGGRRSPIYSGYRPQWDLGHRTEAGERFHCDARVRLEQVEKLEPGAVGYVRLHPLSTDLRGRVGSGSVLGMYEGSRQLGEAHVLEVVRPRAG